MSIMQKNEEGGMWHVREECEVATNVIGIECFLQLRRPTLIQSLQIVGSMVNEQK